MRKSCFLLIFILLWIVPNLPAQNPYIHHYTTQDGLPSNTVYYIFQDSKKFIWFATDAGVSRYDGTTFTNFRKKDGLASNDVICIKEDMAGRKQAIVFPGGDQTAIIIRHRGLSVKDLKDTMKPKMAVYRR